MPVPVPLSPAKRKPHRTHRRRLHFRYLGARGHRMRIALWATGATVRNVAVTLREHGHLIARLHIARLGSHRRVFSLREHGRGTYRLAIAAQGAMLRALLRIP